MTIGVLAVATAAIRAAGPVLLGGRELPAPVQEVIGLLAPALLAALVVVETFSGPAGGELEVDERVLGVGAAGIVLARGGSLLPAVAIAAIVTAVARALLS
ncbi:MAG TPA: AzlD domain-containing protein [Rhodospirillales bacterium]|nr:AzlD domain-containing protein [Rhodospirillales bacterium]